jgi:hypothetical protein
VQSWGEIARLAWASAKQGIEQTAFGGDFS